MLEVKMPVVMYTTSDEKEKSNRKIIFKVYSFIAFKVYLSCVFSCKYS